MRPFFNHIPLNAKGVEVGTFEAYNASNLLKYCSLDKLYCIDPYRPYVDIVGGLGNFSPETWEAIYRKALIRTNGSIIRKPSLEAVRDFSDNSLDFVYLDGDHSGDNVLKEIIAWLPKVKVGGVFGGHDYNESGVLQSITEWNVDHPEYDDKITTQALDWWLIKQ